MKRPHPAPVADLIEAISHSEILLPSGPRCPPGKEAQQRSCCACEWSGPRSDTIDIGWCPKCRKARALALSADERKTISQKAARTRWKVPRATHMGTLPIAGMLIPCAVLSDGRRVLSQRGFYAALGATKPSGRGQEARADDMPQILASKNVEPYISAELRATVSAPIIYQFLHDDTGQKGGASIAHGIDAKIIPEVCDVFLAAREEGVLQRQQLHIAKAAEVLVRGLARVGIIALVDEATGYQADRDRDELSKILEAYIAEELRPWVRLFPHEFFKTCSTRRSERGREKDRS